MTAGGFMPHRSSWVAMSAAMAALLAADRAAGQEALRRVDVEHEHVSLVLQAARSRYAGRGLTRVCERDRGCAVVGESLSAQLGVRVEEGFDALFALRKVWTDNPGPIYQPSVGVAWWPSQGVFSTRVHVGVSLVVLPGTVGFDAHLGGDVLVFPVKFLGVGLAGEVGPVGFLGGSSLRTSHIGAAIHLRL